MVAAAALSSASQLLEFPVQRSPLSRGMRPSHYGIVSTGGGVRRRASRAAPNAVLVTFDDGYRIVVDTPFPSCRCSGPRSRVRIAAIGMGGVAPPSRMWASNSPA
jgi:hypothetical protein